LALFVMGTSALAAGCAGATEDDTEASQDEVRRAEITESGKGKTFTFEKGQDIKLALASNPTTGFKWQVTSVSKGLGYPTPKEGSYESDSGGRIGGGGKQRFVWKTASNVFLTPGSSHLVKLELRRSFEDRSAPAADTFTFTVKIKGAAPAPAPEPAEASVIIEEASNGKTVKVSENQWVSIRLPENASTGAAWELAEEDRTLGQPERTYQAPTSDRAGDSGFVVFSWNTTPVFGSLVGKYPLQFALKRGSQTLETFKVTLDIRAN